MRRTMLLLTIVALLLTAGCTARGAAGPASSRAPAASGSGPVASWRLAGGYSLAGVTALRPPRLVVYPDGQTIADAAYRTDLTTDEVSQLVGYLVADLRSPAASRHSTGAAVADAPTTVLTVRSSTGTFSATAAGLDELRDERGYSDQVYDARDRLDALRRRIMVGGQPYTAERVRVVVEPVDPDGSVATGVPVWPAELKMPDKDAADRTRLADLDGAAARAAVRLLERDLDLNGAWQTYRAADGALVRASWRYLLPDE